MNDKLAGQGARPISRLAAGNCGFLFLSFAACALMNALPQIFYARYAGEQRALLLSASLFLAAILSVLGNRTAQRNSPLLCSRAVFYGTACATVTLVLVCAWQTDIPVPVYFLCQLVLAFVMSCFLQLLDRRVSESAGEAHRSTNDLMTNLFRFCGMLLAPLWFWLFAPGTLPAMLGTLLFACCVVVSLSSVKGVTTNTLKPAAAGTHSAFSERLFLGFAMMVYATYGILSASLAYLLSELTGQDASRDALLLIVMIFASALGFTAVCLMFGLRLGRRLMLVAPGVVAVSGFFLPPMLMLGTATQVAGCVVFGVAYGSYMLVMRDVLSDFALRRRSSHYIAWFNNVPNVGAIFGFGLLALIAVVCRLGGYSFAAVVTVFVSVFAGVQVVMALCFLAGVGAAPDTDASDAAVPAGETGSVVPQ
ncbi:MAG: hypothetical protein SV422_07065 [Pseudomonadota bacterium]|nr:hypothetical protein [Pseudomonadota bacterium]